MPRLTTVKGCALRVVGVGVTEAIPADDPPTSGCRPGLFRAGHANRLHGRSADVRSWSSGDVVTRLVGEELRWVLLIENSSYIYGTSGTLRLYRGGVCRRARDSDERPGDGFVCRGGDSYSAEFSRNGGRLAPHELAWAEVPYIIPANAPSTFPIIIWATADDSANLTTTYETADRNTDTITIAGPGFNIVSFTAHPTQQVPGGLVHFRSLRFRTRGALSQVSA